MTYAMDQTLAYLASLPDEPASAAKVDIEIDTFCAEYRGGAASARQALLQAVREYRDFPVKTYVLDRLAGARPPGT
jgi:hypothetical protein